MSGWDELLRRLAETPRENGTAALHETAVYLHEALTGVGLSVELWPFTAHPYTLRLAGVIALAGGLFYLRAVRARRFGAALAVAVAIPGLLLAELEFQLPVFGWLGAQTQYHVVARAPGVAPEQRIVFTAHYDTKTDLLDHVERAPVDFLAAPLITLMLAGAAGGLLAPRVRRGGRALGRLARVAGYAGAVYGALAFAAMSAGALLPSRSPGALDDGAACAVLVRLAAALAEAPALERTDVEVVFFSAEEVGVQGSWLYAQERFSQPPDLPTRVVNLESLGASARHGVLPRERFTLRSFAADSDLLELLDRVHHERFGLAVERLPVGGATDARSFLAHGIPALTLVTRAPGEIFPRGLHSARDDRARIDEAALDASLGFLLAVVREANQREP